MGMVRDAAASVANTYQYEILDQSTITNMQEDIRLLLEERLNSTGWTIYDVNLYSEDFTSMDLNVTFRKPDGQLHMVRYRI